MTFRPAFAAACAAALLAPAAAQASCNLKTIDVPIKMEGLRPIVTAKINGEPVKLMLDSGSFYNTLDGRFAAQQKLRPAGRKVTGSRFTEAASTVTTGVGGQEVATGVIIAPSFEFAGAKFSNIAFMAVPSLGHEASGLLGQNFLHQLDNEYDLKNGVMRLVQPQDCGTLGLAYWATAGTTFSAAPLERTNGINAHTVSIVTVNGEKMRALFDTGASTSFITKRAAARAGVKTTDTGVKPAGLTGGIDRADIKTWVAPFASVKIGDEEIKNGLLRIGDTDADSFDMLIGADFFLAHHIYVANSQGTIYFTYNGGPVFNVQTSDVAER